jgi:hypothetical protein
MSETEHFKGKLIKVELEESLEKTCEKILNEHGVKDNGYFESIILLFEDFFYTKEYAIVDDVLYKLNFKRIEDEESIFTSEQNEDGSIDFEVKYYNGGCGFNEALEEALENIK